MSNVTTYFFLSKARMIFVKVSLLNKDYESFWLEVKLQLNLNSAKSNLDLTELKKILVLLV